MYIYIHIYIYLQSTHLRGATQGLRGSRLGFLPSENMAAARNSHESIGYKWAVSNHSRANF